MIRHLHALTALWFQRSLPGLSPLSYRVRVQPTNS
jgi:hypothetical protein